MTIAYSEPRAQFIRDDLQVTESGLDNPTIEGYYSRASEAGVADGSTESWIRVLAIRQLIAGASKEVDTRANEVEVKKSQRVPNLLRLLKIWTDQFAVDEAGSDEASSGVMFGNLDGPLHRNGQDRPVSVDISRDFPHYWNRYPDEL